MLYTILQIFAFQALFLLVYDLLLRRETFFNYNRAYLLITSILSLVLPFIKFSTLKSFAARDYVIELPEIFIGVQPPTLYEITIAEQAGIVLEQPQTPIWQIIGIVGISIASILFLVKVIKLLWLKKSNPKRWKGNVLIVKLLKSSAAFSFFNTIFLGEKIPKTETYIVYKHELVHIKEYHTVDLLFFEMLRIIFWFNPLVYIYQNRIKELHEFIADEKAVKLNGKYDYYQSLLNQVFDVNNVSFTNSFFKKSLIKKRIAMLQKSKSKQLNLIKYTLLFPLVFAMLIHTSTEVRAQQKQKQTQAVDQELSDEQLKKKYYDEIAEKIKNGANYKEITDSLWKDNRYKYLMSREEYLRMSAFTEYMLDQSIERKSEKGTLEQNDIDRAEAMKSGRYKNYAEYREWKATNEAKEQWELSTQNGILKLFVEVAANKTDKEKQRFNALMKQLETDAYFKKLVITDGQSTMVIDSPNSQHPKANDTLKVVESIEVPFSVIDEVPTIDDCKDLPTNAQRKQCMSQFVSKHVNKNFNLGLADSLGIKGRQRIFVSFKIDKEGLVKDVKARASHPDLENEAVRVIKTLPQFIPGRQKGHLVTVPYSLPIVFQIGSKANSKTPNYEKFMDSLSVYNFKKLKELTAERDRILKNSSEQNPVVINLNKQIDHLRKGLLESIEKVEVEEIEATDKSNLNDIPFSVVEISPTHPDCKTIKANEERKKCTSAAVNTFVNKNYNRKITETLGLTDGQQRIFAAFTIDKQGFVKDVKARAAHPKLEEEIIRVIKMFPQFIPGEHQGKKVDVPYSLPIIFQIANDKKKKN
ncbi:energy transducer TonB [Winogradskyella sp.]|uniref:energy transducer TonB n=1 Tax=Winogradskyella sp. TaxID=1883156 RepID=UPI003F6CBCCC